MNRFIRCLLILLPLVLSVQGFSHQFDDSLITDRGRGSREKPNLYDWNQQRLRDEGRYRSPGSTSNYYYQQDKDSYYYQTPRSNSWEQNNNVPVNDYFPR